jgi:hypothetical protein
VKWNGIWLRVFFGTRGEFSWCTVTNISDCTLMFTQYFCEKILSHLHGCLMIQASVQVIHKCHSVLCQLYNETCQLNPRSPSPMLLQLTLCCLTCDNSTHSVMLFPVSKCQNATCKIHIGTNVHIQGVSKKMLQFQLHIIT